MHTMMIGLRDCLHYIVYFQLFKLSCQMFKLSCQMARADTRLSDAEGCLPWAATGAPGMTPNIVTKNIPV